MRESVAKKTALEESTGRAQGGMDMFQRENESSAEEGSSPPTDALSVAAETQAFCEHFWTTDPEYARFVVKAIRKGFFEAAPGLPPPSRKEAARRLLHLKRFYWARVLGGSNPSEDYTAEFIAQHEREASVICKILSQRRRAAEVPSLLKPGGKLALALADNEHTLKMITLILEIATTTDKMRKQVDAFKSIEAPKGQGERRKQLKEIGETGKQLAQLFGKLSRMQLKMREDKWRSGVSKYLESKLNQLSTYGLSDSRHEDDGERGANSGEDVGGEEPLIWFDRKGGLYEQMGDLVRSQFSWFPSSRL